MLKQQEGDLIRKLIWEITRKSQNEYARMVGISAPHFPAYLNGQRHVSLELLQQMLSGLGFTVECQVTINLLPFETGQPVQDANFTPLETTLSYEDQV